MYVYIYIYIEYGILKHINDKNRYKWLLSVFL